MRETHAPDRKSDLGIHSILHWPFRNRTVTIPSKTRVCAICTQSTQKEAGRPNIKEWTRLDISKSHRAVEREREKNRGNWLCRHLWCSNDLCGSGIVGGGEGTQSMDMKSDHLYLSEQSRAERWPGPHCIGNGPNVFGLIALLNPAQFHAYDEQAKKNKSQSHTKFSATDSALSTTLQGHLYLNTLSKNTKYFRTHHTLNIKVRVLRFSGIRLETLSSETLEGKTERHHPSSTKNSSGN